MPIPATIDVDMSDVTKRLTLTVHIRKSHTWRFRVALGVALIRLASHIIGCNVVFIPDEGSEVIHPTAPEK